MKFGNMSQNGWNQMNKSKTPTTQIVRSRNHVKNYNSYAIRINKDDPGRKFPTTQNKNGDIIRHKITEDT